MVVSTHMISKDPNILVLKNLQKNEMCFSSVSKAYSITKNTCTFNMINMKIN